MLYGQQTKLCTKHNAPLTFWEQIEEYLTWIGILKLWEEHFIIAETLMYWHKKLFKLLAIANFSGHSLPMYVSLPSSVQLPPSYVSCLTVYTSIQQFTSLYSIYFAIESLHYASIVSCMINRVSWFCYLRRMVGMVSERRARIQISTLQQMGRESL